jgi:hypothetical protein
VDFQSELAMLRQMHADIDAQKKAAE